MENTQKKSSGKISYTLQIIGLLPLLALGIAMLFFTSQWFTKTMYQEVERELYDATKSATTLLNAAYPGDYHLEGDVAYLLYKGETDITRDYSLLDQFKEDTGLDITLFYQDTRILTTLYNAQGDRIVGSGAPDVAQVEYYAIPQYAIKGNLLDITDKTSGKIIIAADDNVMDYVVVEANGGRLTATIDKSINNLSNADVTVTVPANGSIRALDASSAAKISGDVVLNADKFAMDASSAAKIDVSVKAQSCAVAASSASKINASVEAVSCSVEASSASKITLKGSAAKCTADLSSASKLSAGDFVAAECSVNTSSAAKAVVNCTERLHADASSGSSIRYSGDCRTSINKSSGGSVGRN